MIKTMTLVLCLCASSAWAAPSWTGTCTYALRGCPSAPLGVTFEDRNSEPDFQGGLGSDPRFYEWDGFSDVGIQGFARIGPDRSTPSNPGAEQVVNWFYTFSLGFDGNLLIAALYTVDEYARWHDRSSLIYHYEETKVLMRGEGTWSGLESALVAPAAIPLPATLPLLGTAIGAIVLLRRRRSIGAKR